MKTPQSNHYLALSGGVGGAKLVLGLSAVLEPDQLTVVANTGDDFEHLGLNICPDIDTVLYTLADWNNKELGWGQAEESWNFLAALKRLGGEGWFSLGDRDMATHILRTLLLDAGASLSEVIERLSAKMNIAHRIVPMTDEQVRTQVHCREQGTLSFQHYFVRDRCQPEVTGFEFTGIDKARFKRPVEPGDQLIIEVKIERRIQNMWKCSGTAKVEGNLACRTELMFTYKDL